MKSNAQSAANNLSPSTEPLAVTPNGDYLRAVKVLTDLAWTSNRLADLQRQIDGVLVAAAEEMQAEYTLLQVSQGEQEAELENIARSHPEWFDKKKSMVTPVGVCKLTATSELEITDAAVTLALLDQHFPTTAAIYKKIDTTLRKEALETMSDADLEKIRVKRVKGQSFKVTPAKVKLGEAVAKAVEAHK